MNLYLVKGTLPDDSTPRGDVVIAADSAAEAAKKWVDHYWRPGPDGRRYQIGLAVSRMRWRPDKEARVVNLEPDFSTEDKWRVVSESGANCDDEFGEGSVSLWME